LLKREYRVLEEWPYIDADSGDPRTLDIYASRLLSEIKALDFTPRLDQMLALLIECKQSELPYVAFESVSPPAYWAFPLICGAPHSEISIEPDTATGHSTTVRLPTALGLQPHRFVETPPLASMLSSVDRRGGEKGKLDLTGEQAYNRIMLPLTKALRHYRNYWRTKASAGPKVAHLTLGIAVVDAPLLLAHVPGDRPQLEHVAWFRMIRHHTQEERGSRFEQDPSFIDVVHKDFFQDYLRRYVEPFAEVFRRRTSELEKVLLAGKGVYPGLRYGDKLPGDLHKRLKPAS
jgi:hypothetical protein